MNIFSEAKEGFFISIDAIRGNKMRSILTTLGIIIGIVTVTLMATAIEGLNSAFLQSISAIGADVLYVQRTPWFNRTYADWVKIRNRPRLTVDQFRALEKQITGASALAPASYWRLPVKYKARSSGSVQVVGTTDQFLLTSSYTLNSGRFFSMEESDGGELQQRDHAQHPWKLLLLYRHLS